MQKAYFPEKIAEIFSSLPKASVLDLGAGEGRYSSNLASQGFDVTAADLDSDRFCYHGKIKFQKCDLKNVLPFNDKTFDYVLFLEVVEHLKNPFFVISEISRVLKPNGCLVISTPNILNMGSRLRFLFEGSFDFFREPLVDYIKTQKNNEPNMHFIPWRYQELEYLLKDNNLAVDKIYTDQLKVKNAVLGALFYPFMRLHAFLKKRRALRKSGVNYSRINKILFSKELIFGRHLIIKAVKTSELEDERIS